MLRELEDRLATLLGADLPAPLAGRVQVRPGAPNGDAPAAQIAVRHVTPVSPDFGDIRTEIAPGDPARRRIVRLSAEIDIRLSSGGTDARDTRRQALDDLIYFLDAPNMRSGEALRDAGDAGFLLDSLHISAANYAPALNDPVGADLTLTAVGWFWPVGEVGQDGPAIAEARITQLVYPLGADPDPARFVAGTNGVVLSFAFSSVHLMSLRADGPGNVNVQRIAFQVLSADGSAGAGELTSGRDIGGGIRVRNLADGEVRIRYRPPAAPAQDRLILRLVREGETDHFGPVLMELPLMTEAPA